MNRRIFVIQVFSGLLYQTVRYFLLQGEEGEKMGKRRLRMMAVAMALVVAAGSSFIRIPAFVISSLISSVIFRISVQKNKAFRSLGKLYL